MTTVSETVLRKGGELEVTIDSVSYGGQGVARWQDRVIFVAGAYAGDRVVARLTKIKKTFCEARAVRILAPSPDRVSPRCSHFRVCGGCTLQDLSYEAQLEVKRTNVRDVFERIGGFANIDVPRPLPSPQMFGYRNKMEFTFGDRRWKVNADEAEDDSFALGFHVPQRYDKVVMIDECHLASDRVNALLTFIREFARASGRPPYSVRRNEGFWRFLVLRESAHCDELMVHVITSEEDERIQGQLAKEVRQRFPFATCLVNGIRTRNSQVAVAEKEVVLLDRASIHEKLGPYRFRISPASFFQTNTRAAEMLYETARTLADLRSSDEVWDLYSGTGSIAIYLSGHVRSVVGIEWVEDAVLDARQNAEQNGVTNCSFHAGDLKEVIRRIDKAPDVVIVDPPRSGMHADVVETIAERRPRTVVYISCNPATQARDAALLCRHAYRLDVLQPVDLFPHTYHIENIAKFVRIDS